jgi:lipopolysaccharide export system permease protein
MAIQFTATFSTKAGMNPLLAVWIPNIIFGFLALVMYRRKVK